MLKNNVQILLHLIVFVWGASGPVSDLIQLPTDVMVFWRMFIALSFFVPYLVLKKNMLYIAKNNRFNVILAGVVLAFHWIAFFESIRLSTISLGLICLSTVPFFTTCLDPIFKKTWRINMRESFLAILCFFGVALIFKFEINYGKAICIGLISAFLDALSIQIISKLSRNMHPVTLTSYQMFIGVLCLYCVISLKNSSFFIPTLPKNSLDLLGLIFLGFGCTVFGSTAYTWCLKRISTFQGSLILNLEPIYGIALAFIFFGKKEIMHPGFYLGSFLIFSTIFFTKFSQKTLEA